jgi:glycosyltransferase involved in cell wall biosynthesis
VDGDTGALVPIGQLTPLVGAIGRLASEPGRAQELGRAARLHNLLHFDIDTVARQWLDVLEAIEGS